MADFNMNTTLTELAGRQVLTAKQPQAIEKSSVSKEFSDTEQSTTDVVKGLQQEKLDETITQINDSLQNIQRNLKFSVDNDLGIVVVNVTDKVTDKLVRQIPSEEVLELARNLQEMNLNLPQPTGERSESHSRSRTEGVFLRTSV